MVLYESHNFSKVYGAVLSDAVASNAQAEAMPSIIGTQPFDGRTCQVHTAPEGGVVKLQSNDALAHMANVSDADKQTPLEKREVSWITSFIDVIKSFFVKLKNKIFGSDEPANKPLNNDTRGDHSRDTSHDDMERGAPERLVANIADVSAEDQRILQTVRENPEIRDEAQARADENDEQMWLQPYLAHGSAHATASDIDEPSLDDEKFHDCLSNIDESFSDDDRFHDCLSDTDEPLTDDDGGGEFSSLSNESANLEESSENTLSDHVGISEEAHDADDSFEVIGLEQQSIPASRVILEQVKKTKHYIEYDVGDIKIGPRESAINIYSALYMEMVDHLSAENLMNLVEGPSPEIKLSINDNKVTVLISERAARELVGDSRLNKMACAAEISLEATETRVKVDIKAKGWSAKALIASGRGADLVSEYLEQHISNALAVI